MNYKRLSIFLLGLFIVFIFGYHYWLPPEPYFDEVHSVNFIREFMNGRYQNHYITHPPLWHLMTTAVVSVWGDHAVSWRLISLLAGLGALVLMYPLTKKIIGESEVAVLAVFFMVFDGISMVQARSAMINSLQMVFVLFSLLSFLLYLKQPAGKEGWRHLFFSGIFFGLAVSTKMVAVSLLLIIIPLFIGHAVRNKSPWVSSLLWGGLCFLVIPFVIFFCVHLPTLVCEGQRVGSFGKMWAFNLNYHATMRNSHPYSSKWWSWPLMLRPVWFYFQGQYWNTPGAICRGIVCLGNPAVFWVIPLVIPYLIGRFFWKKEFGVGIILLGFFTQWLSYSPAGRLTLFHYFYFAIPFVDMAVALTVFHLWQKGRIGKGVVIVYLILVGVMYVYWYPLWTGLPVTQKFYEQHMWFSRWI